MHSADVICFLVVVLEVLYLPLDFTLICGKYMFSFMIVPNFKLISVFNRKIIWRKLLKRILFTCKIIFSVQ